MAIYDVVIADERAPRDGRFIEKIGTYNPNTDPASININNDRALKWLLNGAQPTDTVKAMLSYRGVLIRKHLQIGVLKGAITQEEADNRFEEWKSKKEAAISGKVDRLSQQKSEARQKALDAETAKNTARLEALRKREAEAIAASEAAEAPQEEATPDAEKEDQAAENVATPENTPVAEESAPNDAPAEVEVPAAETTPAAEDVQEEGKEAPVEVPAAEEAPEAEKSPEQVEVPAAEKDAKEPTAPAEGQADAVESSKSEEGESAKDNTSKEADGKDKSE